MKGLRRHLVGATTIYIILGASMQFLLYNYSTRFRVLIADNYFLQKKKKKNADNKNENN